MNHSTKKNVCRVAFYVRCSTLEQNTSMQITELQDYALSRAWSVYRIYEDMATGTNTNRASFQEMMKDARDGKFDVLAIWKLDRFARSLKDLVNNLQELTDLGVGFVSIKDSGVDVTSPSGRLLLHLLSAFSEFEASLIRMRVKSGLDAARRKGKRLGRPKTVDDLVVRELRAKGRSIRQIARELGVSTMSVQRALKGVTKSPESFLQKAQ